MGEPIDFLEVVQDDRDAAALDALRAGQPLLAANIINGFRDEYPLTQRQAKIRQSYKENGRFSVYSTAALSAQCRMQSRDNLDPEYSQFMNAVADRLDSPEHTNDH